MIKADPRIEPAESILNPYLCKRHGAAITQEPCGPKMEANDPASPNGPTPARRDKAGWQYSGY